MNVKLLISAIIGGVAITLVTGLIPNAMLVGASHYGYPLAWLIQLVLAPEHYPWRINVLNLVIDIIFWIVIAGVILFALKKAKK